MATYKLMQDIEAEDKILGPLTLRQFIFALVTVFLGYICFVLVTQGLMFLLIVFVPPTLFCAFFAFPFGKDQPTELWALGKINYWFKPRKRIWNQSGVKELVTITVPKKIEHIYTNGLSQSEVRSRLNALASTIDSRGWAVKNVNVNLYAPQPLLAATSDRLLDLDSIPQEVPTFEVAAADDILDETNNPIARQFDTMITQSAQQHRSQLVSQLNESPAVTMQPATGAAEPWFINPAQPLPEPEHATAADRAAEAALSSQIKAHNSQQQVSYSNLRTLRPLNTAPTAAPPLPAVTPVDSPANAMTVTDDPAILALATNDDLNVSTLAREAQKAKREDDRPQDDEVVITLR